MKIIIICIFLLIVLFIYALLCIIEDNKVNNLLLSSKDRYFDKKIKKEVYKPKSIIITTLETRDIPLLKHHNDTVNYYAKKHGYKYIFRNNYENEITLPIYWKKIQLLKDLMEDYKTVDYFIWLDSDSIITHPEIPIEYLLEMDETKSIFIGKDYPCRKFDSYCAGVFIIKNNSIGYQFISDCITTYLSSSKCIDNNKYVLNGIYAGECYEQGIMNELLNTSYNKHLYEIETFFVMNTIYPAYGTVILHLYDRNKRYVYDKFDEYLKNFIELIPNKKNPKPLKIAILLTMYIGNSKKKFEMYMKNIMEWLKTGLDIYIVESSGFEIPLKHPLLKTFIFSQQNNTSFLNFLFQNNISLKERDSILNACNHFDFSLYDMVFKVTGKYFSDDFLNMINYIPSDADLVLQYQTITHGQNSEIVGFSPKIIKSICLKIDEKKYNNFESVLKNIDKNKLIIYRLKKLSIKYKTKRSDGSTLDYL